MPISNIQLLERTIHKIRQRMFNLPEWKQSLATQAILKLKQGLPPSKVANANYHWMYTCE